MLVTDAIVEGMETVTLADNIADFVSCLFSSVCPVWT